MKNTVNFNEALETVFNKGVVDGLEKEYIPFILSVTKARTPVDTGRLRDSEKAEIYEMENRIICEVSANTDYATIQHEMPNYYHKTGESGYILNPMMETSDAAVKMLGDSVKAALKGGGKK